MTNNYTSQFKTKTEIKEANNGGIKGVWLSQLMLDILL